MLRPTKPRLHHYALLCAVALAGWGCDGGSKAPALSHTEEVVRQAPVPPENGPKLGIVAELARVQEFTDVRAPSIGVLRAGAKVARSAEPVSRSGCAGGWYAIRPRGFVCVGTEATLDLNHPTLAVMALQPNADAKLPYTYARTRVETPVFERSQAQEDAVREIGKLHRRAAMAVVGSWKAKEPSGSDARLALLTDGHFIRASDLEAAKGSDFSGVELGRNAELPIAFVVKRGVRSFQLNGNEAEKGDLVEYHSELLLSGRFRSLGSVKYWELDSHAAPGGTAMATARRAANELWVRHQDVTVVQKRSAFPDFVKDDTRWLDISASMGTLVAYEGKRAVFVTLLSIARELPETAGATQPVSDGARGIPLGTFAVTHKGLTLLGKQPPGGFGEPFEVADAPWALELSSGQVLHGAYWHDRFGIEHGAGTLELSPSDAARIFHFVGPELPPGWHSIAVPANQGTPVVIRK
ncbi:MAG TPA: L,D-transpeptidase [Polyangiaceae bacterium]|nr:L,D-transpeptidase [Polyangiaceae bacterium]